MQRRHRLAILPKISKPVMASLIENPPDCVKASLVEIHTYVTASLIETPPDGENLLSRPHRTVRRASHVEIHRGSHHYSTRCCACGGGEHLGHHGSFARVDDRS